MEVLVYCTPFWSFTSINSTSFFSTLHCLSGATEDSLCSGTTWMFIFSRRPHACLVPSRPEEVMVLMLMISRRTEIARADSTTVFPGS
jgi:hypothetical protein